MELTPVQQQALDRAKDAPPRVIDPGTQESCVLLRSADFDWIRGLLEDLPQAPRSMDPRTRESYAILPEKVYERIKALFEDDPLTLEEQKSLLRKTGKRAGWEDPGMDVYNELDPRRPS